MMNNALMASDYVIIPIPPSDQFALDGLAAYLDLIQSIRQHNSRLMLLGILITKYDPLWGNSKQNLAQIRKYFTERGVNIFQGHISNTADIDLAHIMRKSIFETNLESSGAVEYSAVAREILDFF
jgi:chromosome partitioning protein